MWDVPTLSMEALTAFDNVVIRTPHCILLALHHSGLMRLLRYNVLATVHFARDYGVVSKLELLLKFGSTRIGPCW